MYAFLLVPRRRGRVTADQISEFIDDLGSLPIRIGPPSGSEQLRSILVLSERYRVTAHDAAYLELAQRSGLPLATLDGDLRKAALAAGVALVET